MDKVEILNAEFDPLTLQGSADRIFAMLETRESGWIATVNVAILMMMRQDAWLQAFVDRASLVIADGQPIVWYSRWLKRGLPERVTGIDLVGLLCERAAAGGKRVYLLGATDDVAARAAQRLREAHPGLQIDCANGYFSENEAENRAQAIGSKRIDILFVGMGVPRQERFIERQWAALNVGIAIGVGGSLDVLAGLRKRAPVWVQRIGLEWMFRLIQEPRRLFLRYLTTNSRFAFHVASEMTRRLFGRA